MKEIDAAQMRANLTTLTVEKCRSTAVESSINAERLFDEGNDAGALFAQQQATMWATLALSCTPAPMGIQIDVPQAPAPENPIAHTCCHTSQRLPSARLLAAGDPEPQVNPGTLYVDPAGTGARYLLRIDGVDDREWLWCDSLAQAEATMRYAGTWATAMGCGIIRVREATEREQVEFREGTGGAALDLVRRLLNALGERASTAGHTLVAQWLADCADQAWRAYGTQQWPAPPAAEAPNLQAEYGAEAALRRAAEMAPEAPNGPVWRDWLLACARAGIGPGKDPWPAPPSRDAERRALIVRVENPGPDLERLNSATLTRLRDAVQARIVERAQTSAKVAGTRGGAAQWREG